MGDVTRILSDIESGDIRCGNFTACFFHQLHRLFVHANHRARGIVRFFVGFQHVFHVGHELRVRFGRPFLNGYGPVLGFLIRHAVFLSVCRTVSWLIDPTTFSSTTFRLKKCRLLGPAARKT